MNGIHETARSGISGPAQTLGSLDEWGLRESRCNVKSLKRPARPASDRLLRLGLIRLCLTPFGSRVRRTSEGGLSPRLRGSARMARPAAVGLEEGVVPLASQGSRTEVLIPPFPPVRLRTGTPGVTVLRGIPRKDGSGLRVAVQRVTQISNAAWVWPPPIGNVPNSEVSGPLSWQTSSHG